MKMAKSKSVENNEGSVGVTMEQAVKEGLKADDQIVAMTTKVENTPKTVSTKRGGQITTESYTY